MQIGTAGGSGVNMLRTFAWLAAGSTVLWLSAATALGLGEIEVKSKLNQRFSAVIPMTSVSADEAETVLISLASNEDFERTGIERTEYLSTLKFAVNTEGGNPRIVVSSASSAREPYLSFLLEVRSRSGRTLREYTVLLDPPELQVAPPKPVAPKPAATEFYETPEEQARRLKAAPTPAAKPAAPVPPQPVIAAPVPAPAAPAIAQPAPDLALPMADSYGPVQGRETLWSIATKLRPDASVSMDQVLLAIYKANPKAFDGFNGLRKGSVLKVPSAEDMRATGASAARARIAELRGMPRTAAPAAPAASLPEPVPAYEPPPAPPAPVSKPPPKPLPPPAPVAAPKADKPLLPPTPPPAPPPVTKKPEPVVVAPPPASAPPPPAEIAPTPPAPETPPPAAVDQPLIAEQPLIPETPAAAVEPPPAVLDPVEPAAEVASNNSGLYLWLIIGLILLGAGGFLGWRFWKGQKGDSSGHKSFIPSSVMRRKAAAETAAASKPSSKSMKPMSAPMPVDEPSSDNLQDTLAQTGQMGGNTGNFASQTLDATRETPASRFDSTLAMSTGQSPGYNANATLSMDTPATRTSQTQTLSPSARVDFDVTSQFAAETMSINLDANDPVSEADFHLAYGLYDEAALLLKQAAEKDPGRTEVRVKLAETYFAASRPTEFQQVAESLKGQLPEAEWQKLAIMGMQLCPDAPIFADAGDVSALGGGDIDLSFDEPVSADSDGLSESTVAMPAMDFSLDPIPAAAPVPAPSSASSDIGGLDFKLEELELPRLDEAKLDIPSSSGSGNSLDFKLADINLHATSPGTSEVAKNGSLKFDNTNSMQTVALSTMGGDDEVRLDDFDLNEASTAISAGDEAGTKLDLARAYADMGDNDMARTLLKEVLEQGSSQQQQEAQSLMGRLA